MKETIKEVMVRFIVTAAIVCFLVVGLACAILNTRREHRASYTERQTIALERIAAAMERQIATNAVPTAVKE